MVKGSKGIRTVIQEETKAEVDKCLSSYGKHYQFDKANIYVMQPIHESLFTQIQDDLNIRNQEIKRGKAVGLNKIVNIINPGKVAYQFNFTMAEKYVFLSTREVVIKEAEARIETSANKSRKELNKYIEDNQFSSEFIKKITDELEEKIEEERRKIAEIKANPKSYKDIKICGFKNRIEYPQVNYGYFTEKNGAKVKVRTNSHLSIIYPNVLFFEEVEEIDSHKSLMEAKYLEEKGYVEIARDIFVKYQDVKD